MSFALKFKLSFLNTLKFNNRLIMSTSWSLAKAEAQLNENPYFDKYAAKIRELQSKNPEEYEQKLKNVEEIKQKHQEKLKPPNLQKDIEEFKAKEKKGYKNKTLDSIMNVDLLTDKTEKQVEQIWKEYYQAKDDVIYATLTKKLYEEFLNKCKQFPTFLVPLPRGNAYEFFVSQYEENGIHFASLAQFKLHKENCPESLCLTYFPELPQDIVLMLGEYDNKILSGLEASCLVNVLQFFYNSEEQYEMVKHFNKNPQTFDHNDLINAMSNLSLNKK